MEEAKEEGKWEGEAADIESAKRVLGEIDVGKVIGEKRLKGRDGRIAEL